MQVLAGSDPSLADWRARALAFEREVAKVVLGQERDGGALVQRRIRQALARRVRARRARPAPLVRKFGVMP